MNLILLGFVIGVAGFQLLPQLPHPGWFSLLLLLPLGWSTPWLRPLLALLSGLFWAFAWALLQLSASLPQAFEGRDLILIGVIDSIPKTAQRVERFELAVKELRLGQRQVPQVERLRLSWFDGGGQLEAGQVWRLKVRLKRPHGLHNPGGFDYERWLYQQGVGATGYVRHWRGNHLLGRARFRGRLARFRQAIARELAARLQDPRAAALVQALAVGDRSGFTGADWELFARTGTNHLVAISGLHIGMVAGLMFFVGQWSWRRSEWLMLHLAAPRAGAWLALIAALLYAALAGFSLPTQRALIMLGLGLGGLLLGRPVSLGRSFSLALFGVLLCDPLAPLGSGFWLSFGAVAVILYSVAGRGVRSSGWRQWGQVQWAIALGLAPLLLFLFGRVSLIAPLVNLLLVPWFSLLLVPLILLGLPLLKWPLLAAPWLALTHRLADYTLQLLDWSAGLPYAQLHLPGLPLWIWCAGLAGGLLLLIPRGVPGRPLGLLLLAPLFFNRPPRLPEGGVDFTLLDVGQGLSAVIQTRRHLLVYDTGPAYASGFNTAQSVLVPFLRGRGVRRIDLLVVSNADQDHAGGVTALRQAMRVTRTLSGEPAAIGDAQLCRAGMQWRWDGVDFSFLHPPAEGRFPHANDRSCVLRVITPGGRLLLPGDVEKPAEQRLVQAYGDGLHADVLVAPHHGSNSSSTAALVAEVRPRYVLFASGYRNRFGFPRPRIVERWRAAGARTLRTYATGAIEFHLRPDRPLDLPQLFRRQHPHYWSTSPSRDE